MTIVKVCGLTRAEDVELAIACGATMLGFIHVSKSPRYVDVSRLRELLPIVKGRAQRIVVVQNASEFELQALRDQLDFEYFQFHGEEPEHYLAQYQGYRVFHMSAEPGEARAPKTFGEPFLLDTAVRGQKGGTGKTFDWSVLDGVKGQYLVAGGLNPDNVADLITRYKPWGVDVSSGIEASPGVKDPTKLRSFLKNAQKENLS